MTEPDRDWMYEIATAIFWEANYQERVVKRGRWWSRHLYYTLCTMPPLRMPVVRLDGP